MNMQSAAISQRLMCAILSFFFFYIIPLLLFIYLVSLLVSFGCVGSSLLHVGATLRCCAWSSYCSDFSCCRAWSLGTQASVVVAHGLSSCGAWALLFCGMWDLPGPGIEPMSPALAGRFLTTAPPGKSQGIRFYIKCNML